MERPDDPTHPALDDAVEVLRRAGAVFVYVHGSVAAGTAGPGSDLDLAAWFDGADLAPWDLDLPGVVDLLVLDRAPLELAGRVALHGRLVYEADAAARVRWEATTRKIYLDERHRTERFTRDLVRSVRGTGDG